MIFDKIDASAPSYVIDGIKYEFTSVAANDTFKYKGALVDVYNYVDTEIMELECTFETYNTWKKELLKVLKTWDAAYCKHMKAPHPEMQKVHEAAMMPLTLLMKSNSNFGQLEKMLAAVQKKRAELEDEVTETQAAQIELDKTADDYRKLQNERSGLVDQWEQAVAAMQKRDEAIQHAHEEFVVAKRQLREKQEVLTEREAFLATEQKNK